MEDIRIAVVQMNCTVNDLAGNILKITHFVDRAIANKIDIVCFPELSVCGYNAGDNDIPEPELIHGDSVTRLAKLGIDSGVTFLAGLLERDKSGIVYNTQVVFGPEGVHGYYRKTHVPTSENGTWAQGDEMPVFKHAKARFGIEICYDSHFPEVSTVLAEKGAEILFLPHASAGETSKEKRDRFLRYMPARAYDNTVYLAVCNQIGDNGRGIGFGGVAFICNARGEVVSEAQTQDQDEMVIADLRGADLYTDRRTPGPFFRHFRRPEMYRLWAEEIGNE